MNTGGTLIISAVLILTAWNVELTLPEAENSVANVIHLMLLENCFKQDYVKHIVS